MAGDHPATSPDAVGTEGTAASEKSDRWIARGRLVARHWKSWLAALALAAAAWGLYHIGGWTLDTTTFALATLLVIGYRMFTLARDFRSL